MEDFYIIECDSSPEGCLKWQLFKKPNQERFWEACGTKSCIRLLPGGAGGKEPACHCRRWKRREFTPRVGKIPWRRAWQPTPVFLPGESHGQGSLAAVVRGAAQSRTGLKDLTRARTQMVAGIVPPCGSHVVPSGGSLGGWCLRSVMRPAGPFQ